MATNIVMAYTVTAYAGMADIVMADRGGIAKPRIPATMTKHILRHALRTAIAATRGGTRNEPNDMYK